MKKLLAAVLLATALWPVYRAAGADDNDMWAASLGVGNAPVEPPPLALDSNLSLPAATTAPLTVAPAAPAASPATAAPPLASLAPAPIPAPAPRPAVMTLAKPAVVAPAAPPAAATAPALTAAPMPRADGSFFIAGNRFTLEQAFADATIEKLNARGSGSFVILAIEREATKLTAKGAKANTKAAVRELQRAGGAFFLCERDLRQANLTVKDLLPGIRVERGLSAKELQPTSIESAQAGTSVRRIRRACSGDDDPARAVIAAGQPPSGVAPPPRAQASVR